MKNKENIKKKKERLCLCISVLKLMCSYKFTLHFILDKVIAQPWSNRFKAGLLV